MTAHFPGNTRASRLLPVITHSIAGRRPLEKNRAKPCLYVPLHHIRRRTMNGLFTDNRRLLGTARARTARVGVCRPVSRPPVIFFIFLMRAPASEACYRKVGRQGWQRDSGYRRQGAVENLFFRYKRTLGNSIRACGYESQKREVMIRRNVLNRMAKLGKPDCHAIVGK